MSGILSFELRSGTTPVTTKGVASVATYHVIFAGRLERGGAIELESLELVRVILDVIEDKKANDILVLDIREISLLADYFVICTVETARQLGAIVDAVIPEMKKLGLYSLAGVEGTLESGWVLIDFGDIVVHLFNPEKRAFYALDKLWKDAKTVVHIQ